MEHWRLRCADDIRIWRTGSVPDTVDTLSGQPDWVKRSDERRVTGILNERLEAVAIERIVAGIRGTDKLACSTALETEGVAEFAGAIGLTEIVCGITRNTAGSE